MRSKAIEDLNDVVRDIADRSEEFLESIERGNYSCLLRLLYLPYDLVRIELPTTFQRFEITECYEALSLHRLLGFAFNVGGAGYWADLAVTWLEQGFEPDTMLIEEIRDMDRHKRAKQQTRHRALRIARRWERMGQDDPA